MASGSFLPGGFSFNINGQYYTQGTFIGTQGPFLGDWDIDQIQSIVLTDVFPQSDGTTYFPSFRLVIIDRRTYEETYVYLRAYGLTLANMLSAIQAIDSSAKFTLYNSLVSLDFDTAAISDWQSFGGGVLLNDRMASNQRVYNQGPNTTDIYMYKKRHLSPQVWTCSGNATFADSPTYL